MSFETAVADNKYGSIENYPACRDRGIKAHFKSLEETQIGTGMAAQEAKQIVA
jgi:hypothetical protein